MNFDGGSKGNLGQVGYGGVFRSSQGRILRIYGDQIGINTNNATKLQALEEGLWVDDSHGYEKIIIEGDSHIVINMFKKLQQGTPTSKTSKSWRMEASMDVIQQRLKSKPVIIQSHVKCSKNKIAEWILNVSYRIREDSWDKDWTPSVREDIMQDCDSITRQVLLSMEPETKD
jgi:ribonuclease HI